MLLLRSCTSPRPEYNTRTTYLYSWTGAAHSPAGGDVETSRRTINRARPNPPCPQEGPGAREGSMELFVAKRRDTE